MTNRLIESDTPDYSIRSAGVASKVYPISYVVAFSISGPDVPKRTVIKIDHGVTCLPDASFSSQRPNLQKVIRLAESGDLGSTEVRQNQIW